MKLRGHASKGRFHRLSVAALSKELEEVLAAHLLEKHGLKCKYDGAMFSSTVFIPKFQIYEERDDGNLQRYRQAEVPDKG